MTNDIETLADIEEPMPILYFPAIDRLRIILMIFVCINLFGFPTAAGELVRAISGFAPIAYFIISGYLVLWDGDDRSAQILRAIKRTAIVFAVLAVAYFIMNFVYCLHFGGNVFEAFASKRFWFNFIVMNVWQFDIGTSIWYVQSLLYAYIIIFFLDKLKLLKYDWLIATVLILFAVVTGELSGIFKWNIFGYTYLVGNFFTRALPYILLGGFIQRNMDIFEEIRPFWYYIFIAVGVVLIVVEIFVLKLFGVPGYYSHLIGMPVIAVSVCMLAFTGEDYPGFETLLNASRWHINIIYYICQPAGVILSLMLFKINESAFWSFNEYIGIITFCACFFVAWAITCISRGIRNAIEEKYDDIVSDDDIATDYNE